MEFSSAGAMIRPTHNSDFRKRRGLNWAILGLTYAAMYTARYNFAFANKDLSDAYGFSKTEIGSIITFASLIYGLSAIFNGPLQRKVAEAGWRRKLPRSGR